MTAPSAASAALIALDDVAYRIHPVGQDPLAFNLTDRPMRLRPVRDGGQVVGTLYAAESFDAAFAEVLLPQTSGAGPGPRVLPGALLAGLAVTMLELSLDEVVSLRGLEARRLDLHLPDRRMLLVGDASSYPASAHLAQELYDAHPAAQGVTWTSAQDDESWSVMVWNGRTPADAVVAGRTFALADAAVVSRCYAAAERAGVLIEGAVTRDDR